MKLSDVIKIWDELHKKDTGEIGFCDLEKEIDRVVGIDNDIPPSQTTEKVLDGDKPSGEGEL